MLPDVSEHAFCQKWGAISYRKYMEWEEADGWTTIVERAPGDPPDLRAYDYMKYYNRVHHPDDGLPPYSVHLSCSVVACLLGWISMGQLSKKAAATCWPNIFAADGSLHKCRRPMGLPATDVDIDGHEAISMHLAGNIGIYLIGSAGSHILDPKMTGPCWTVVFTDDEITDYGLTGTPTSLYVTNSAPRPSKLSDDGGFLPILAAEAHELNKQGYLFAGAEAHTDKAITQLRYSNGRRKAVYAGQQLSLLPKQTVAPRDPAVCSGSHLSSATSPNYPTILLSPKAPQSLPHLGGPQTTMPPKNRGRPPKSAPSAPPPSRSQTPDSETSAHEPVKDSGPRDEKLSDTPESETSAHAPTDKPSPRTEERSLTPLSGDMALTSAGTPTPQAEGPVLGSPIKLGDDRRQATEVSAAVTSAADVNVENDMRLVRHAQAREKGMAQMLATSQLFAKAVEDIVKDASKAVRSSSSRNHQVDTFVTDLRYKMQDFSKDFVAKQHSHSRKFLETSAYDSYAILEGNRVSQTYFQDLKSQLTPELTQFVNQDELPQLFFRKVASRYPVTQDVRDSDGYQALVREHLKGKKSQRDLGGNEESSSEEEVVGQKPARPEVKLPAKLTSKHKAPGSENFAGLGDHWVKTDRPSVFGSSPKTTLTKFGSGKASPKDVKPAPHTRSPDEPIVSFGEVSDLSDDGEANLTAPAKVEKDSSDRRTVTSSIEKPKRPHTPPRSGKSLRGTSKASQRTSPQVLISAKKPSTPAGPAAKPSPSKAHGKPLPGKKDDYPEIVTYVKKEDGPPSKKRKA